MIGAKDRRKKINILRVRIMVVLFGEKTRKAENQNVGSQLAGSWGVGWSSKSGLLESVLSTMRVAGRACNDMVGIRLR